MLDIEYSSANSHDIYHSYRCSYCGKHLGEYLHVFGNGDIQNDIDEWEYCPYCGEKL